MLTMKNNTRSNSTDPSMQLERKRISASRIIIVSICLAVFAAGSALPSGYIAKVSAAIQKAAKRAVAPAPKSPKPAPRQSKDAQVISQSQLNADGSITAGQIITDNPVGRTVAEIMAEQSLRPVQESVGKLRPEHEGPDR